MTAQERVGCADMPTRKDRRSAGEHRRTFRRVSQLEPYDWLLAALETHSKTLHEPVSAVYRDVLLSELRRGTSDLWVLRPRRSAEQLPKLPSFTLSGEYTEIPDLLDEAVTEARKRHADRFSSALARLAPRLARSNEVEGWQWADDVQGRGVAIRVGHQRLPATDVDLVTRWLTQDVAVADVVRAALARGLDRYAAKGWDKQTWAWSMDPSGQLFSARGGA